MQSQTNFYAGNKRSQVALSNILNMKYVSRRMRLLII